MDIRYASLNNFMKQNVYGSVEGCWLHTFAAEKFEMSVEFLHENFPRQKLIIFDALRPRRVQRIMWSLVEGTPKQKYVANPDRGSLHNFGFALDLTLTDTQGAPLDMGTEFDEFSPLSEPQFEDDCLATGKLTAAQVENRANLRRIMQAGGFTGISSEWWHFDALPGHEVRSGAYKIIE